MGWPKTITLKIIFRTLTGEKTTIERSWSGMKELIHYIAKSLVDDPESVDVAEIEGNQTTVLELKVAKDDLGKIIGKQGRTAQAMRTILGAVSSKEKKRTVLEIIE
jgi:predicted RNA-binding protein YlqC (UPF0109 family)